MLGVAFSAVADDHSEVEIGKARLVLTAFQCAFLAPSEERTRKLMNLGLRTGREFISYRRANPEKYRKHVEPYVPSIWLMVGGVSADFILGEVFWNQVNPLYGNQNLVGPYASESKKAEYYSNDDCGDL